VRPLFPGGNRPAAGAVILISALACPCPGADVTNIPPQQPAVYWMQDSSGANRYSVEILGLASVSLAALKSLEVEWAALLSVYAEQGKLREDIGLPAMAGTYAVEERRIRFTPRFPLEPGVDYRAVFRPGRLPGNRAINETPVVAHFRMTAARHAPSTVVSQVYPSGNVLPENLLKFYVHFSAPMSRGDIYRHIRLRDEGGAEVELPFLELDEELWDPELKRLTLFIDPGRIKREVRPLEEIGPALQEGGQFTLVIDRTWEDGRGVPLKSSFEKVFRVGAPDRDAPDPARWVLHPPPAGTRTPLRIDFDEPMEHALARRMIRVVDGTGEPIAGQPSLGRHERRWEFQPARVWTAGEHEVIVQTAIEDLAGNNIGKAFEVDLLDGDPRQLTRQMVRLAFSVR